MLRYSYLIKLLEEIDASVLLVINHAHSAIFDKAMWLISDRWIWIPLYLVLLIYIYRRFGAKKCVIVVLMIALLILVTDQSCAKFLRPLFGRLRPSHPENPVSEAVMLVNGYRGGRFGFPSCHAANTFALAIFLSLCVKNKTFTILIISWSVIVSVSRMYLGVHYPGDVVCGWLVGSLFALIIYYGVYKQVLKKMRLGHETNASP